MERRFAIHARAHRQALIVALVLASATAVAAPKKGQAKVQFDRGVAAYTKGDYQAAGDALGKSFALQADPETLFAWAQTERKLGRCDKAIELYQKLLTFDLPAENKEAIKVQIGECTDVLAAEKPAEPAPASTPAEPVAPPAARTDRPEAPAQPNGRPWWKDPVGDTLVGAGVIGVGVGVGFLVSGHSADADKAQATTYVQYKELDDRARSRGQLGVIAAAAGGALVIGGLVWYATHGGGEEHAIVSGWVAPGSGGLAVAGRF